MGRKNGVLLPIFAIVLGVLAVALSFIAYAKRIKADDVGPKVNGTCVYPNSGACAMGIIAAVCLLAEQVLISTGINCICCRGGRFSSACSVITSLILFVLSWIVFVVAFLGLIYTAILNNRNYLAKTESGYKGDTCKVGKESLFLGAAVWCIICTVLGLLSYAFWVHGAANNTNNNINGNSANYGQGVAMGQPHAQLSKERYT